KVVTEAENENPLATQGECEITLSYVRRAPTWGACEAPALHHFGAIPRSLPFQTAYTLTVPDSENWHGSCVKPCVLFAWVAPAARLSLHPLRSHHETQTGSQAVVRHEPSSPFRLDAPGVSRRHNQGRHPPLPLRHDGHLGNVTERRRADDHRRDQCQRRCARKAA